MDVKKYIIPTLLSISLAVGLSSCLGDDEDSFDTKAWMNQNETYFLRMQDSTDGSGKKVFDRVTPVWAPSVTVLAKWHNDTTLTAGGLVPMDNSTVDIKYEGSYINGTLFDAGYRHSSDSLYRCKPSDMIVGVHAILTRMHVGDSVTCVIPSDAGYGASSNSILPYSTLIFNIKLKSIYRYELPQK